MTSAMPRTKQGESGRTYSVDVPYFPTTGKEPFYMRAKRVFGNPTLDRDLRETLAYRLYIAEFKEQNPDLKEVLKDRMANIYAREMLADLKAGKL